MSSTSSIDRKATARIDPKYVKLLGEQSTTTETPTLDSLSFPDFTYRHFWGFLNGWWRLTLNDSRIRSRSNVFVSLSEVSEEVDTQNPVPDPFIGSARYAVYNVAPQNGAVEILIHIDWPSTINTQVSYLVINP